MFLFTPDDECRRKRLLPEGITLSGVFAGKQGLHFDGTPEKPEIRVPKVQSGENRQSLRQKDGADCLIFYANLFVRIRYIFGVAVVLAATLLFF